MMDESVSRFVTQSYSSLSLLHRLFCWCDRGAHRVSYAQHFASYGSPRDGLSHWTTVPDKEVDPTLFRNGGKTYWELDKLKSQPTPGKDGVRLSLHHFQT